MDSFQWLFAVLLIGLIHHSQAKVNRYYRLPKNILPTLYNLSISLENSTMDQSLNKGRVVIEATVVTPTDTITFHKHSTIHIDKIEVHSRGHSIGIIRNTTHETLETYGIQTSEEIETGPIQIAIDFQWQLGNETTESGGYENDDYFLITQMEPYGARQLFPCFDEPEFKAQFAVSVNLINFEKEQTVLANMPLLKYTDTNTWTFELSPQFSTYLLALAIPKSTVDDRSAQAFDGNYNITVLNYYRNVSNAQEAAEMVAKAFKSMERRTGITYPVKKVDYACQDVGFAMENWGLITGVIDSETRVHEAVHGWFGNLVTCAWWDDLWLNEGLTTYYSYLTLLDIKAWTKQLIRESIYKVRHTSLNEEWMFALHNKTYVDDVWTTSVYGRGAAVIQMFHKAMGENFETRLFDYLKSNLYKTVNSATFINALTEKGELEEREMFKSFIFQNDAPLISITYHNDSKIFIVTQKPMHGLANTKWTIPIWFQRSETEREELKWFRVNDAHLEIPVDNSPENYVFDQECVGFANYRIEIGDVVDYHCSSELKPSQQLYIDILEVHAKRINN